MADAVGCVTKAVELALKIKDAVDTVRQNRKDCAQIKRRVERVRHTLSLCEGNVELMVSPAVRDAIEALAEVLGDALELVTGCQEETSALCLYCTAGKLSKQLAKVDRGISDGNCEATFAILVYHISRQTQHGAGPAMPTETEEIHEPLVGDETPEQTPQSSLQKKKTSQSCSWAFKGWGCRRDSLSEGEEDDYELYRYYALYTHYGYGGDGGCEGGDASFYGGNDALFQEIAKVTLAIGTAMKTVRLNKEECMQIDKLASRISLILSQLEHTETKKDTDAVHHALMGLHKTFRQAHKLVVVCQRRSVVILCSPGKLSSELRVVLDEMMIGVDDLIDAICDESIEM